MVTGSVTGSTITFTKGDTSTFDLVLSSTASSADAIVTGSAVASTITFTKGDTSTFDIVLSSTASSADAVITGSVTGSTLTFTKGDTSTFDLEIASTSVLTQDLTTNQTVGGISSGNSFASGSTIEALLRTMLISAIDSSISSLSLKNNASTVWNSSTTREVYNDIGPFNTASFSAAAQSPTGLYPISASLTASGGTTGDFDTYFGDDGFGSSNSFGLGGSQTITKTSPGTVTFTVKSKDPVSFSSKTTSRTATYVYPIYYGSSTTDYSTSGDVDGVLSKSIVSKSTRTVNYDFSNKFAYFCYPASYGDLSSVKDGNGFEVLGAFTKYTRNQAGSAGWSAISYNIYKTATTSVPNQDYVFTF
jgi:hypothetical protein